MQREGDEDERPRRQDGCQPGQSHRLPEGKPYAVTPQGCGKILGVGLTELFEEPENRNAIDGFIEVEGETVRIRTMADWMQTTCKLIGIPYFSRVSDMRGAVHDFVHGCVNNLKQQSSFFGSLLGEETFNISFQSENVDDEQNGVFILTCFRLKNTVNLELLEYGCDGQYDLDSDAGLVRKLCNSIERPLESGSR